MTHNVIISTNEYYIWKLIEKARQGNTVRLLGIGNSMQPFLKGSRDYMDFAAVKENTELCQNDIVFYKSHMNQYVAHRIYSVTENGFYLIGDGNLNIEPLIDRKQIYLKAIGFVRKGKYVSITSKVYQIYVNLWMKLYPFRKHLLRLYHCFCKVSSILKKEKNMKIKEDLMLRNINEDWIIIPMGERLAEFNGIVKTNQSGSFIWKLLEEAKSREEIIAAMLQEYDIDEETAAFEFDTFLNTLLKANMLEV
jgi:hypothetical protein